MTKSAETEIAILQTQMTTVQTDVTEMKSDIKTILANQERNASFEERIERLEKTKNFQHYLVPIVCSVLASILTFLIVSYFASIGKVTPTTSTTNNSTTTSQPASSSGSGGSTPSSANATSNATSTPANPSSTDTQSSNGVEVTLPKVTP